MKKKETKMWSMPILVFLLCTLFFSQKIEADASTGEEYITIEVQASDDNEGLKYAIDSDDESAFSDVNEFTVPAGTSHTIYVKDAAGNITSQTYHAEGQEESESGAGSGEQQINIDLELGNSTEKEDYSNYEYLTDEPVDEGTGTVTNKIVTDGSDNAEKVFYTVKTDTGEVFYMVIDQSQSSDNVYLLNSVTLDDLKSLAADGESAKTESSQTEDNLLSALRDKNETTTENTDSVEGAKGNNNLKNGIIILVLFAVGGGVYYYMKVYKNKKDEMMDMMDAADMDEFEAQDDDEDEDNEVEFEMDEMDDKEKEEFLQHLIEEDEEEALYDSSPEEYFKNHASASVKTTPDENEEDAFTFDDEDNEEEEEEE